MYTVVLPRMQAARRLRPLSKPVRAALLIGFLLAVGVMVNGLIIIADNRELGHAAAPEVPLAAVR